MKAKNILTFFKTGFIILLIILTITGCRSQHKQSVVSTNSHTFAMDSTTFLLDGKPFEIIAGKMPYAQIPEKYWKQRIEMAKAMGINTIATYVFWNYHESVPREFDFTTGNHNLARFISVVQKAGI